MTRDKAELKTVAPGSLFVTTATRRLGRVVFDAAFDDASPREVTVHFADLPAGELRRVRASLVVEVPRA